MDVIPPETFADGALLPEVNPKYFAIEFRSDGTPAALAVAVLNPCGVRLPPVEAWTFGCAARKAVFCAAVICACCAFCCAATCAASDELDEPGWFASSYPVAASVPAAATAVSIGASAANGGIPFPRYDDSRFRIPGAVSGTVFLDEFQQTGLVLPSIVGKGPEGENISVETYEPDMAPEGA